MAAFILGADPEEGQDIFPILGDLEGGQPLGRGHDGAGGGGGRGRRVILLMMLPRLVCICGRVVCRA